MKKYLGGGIALMLAIFASAFTMPKAGISKDPAFDWQVYNTSGSPTSTYILNKTQAQMQSDNPQCNSTVKICFREWNLGHTVPNSVYLKKAS